MLLRFGILVLLALVGFYLFITIFLYFFQSKYVFVPFREIEARPSDIGLKYEDIKFDSIGAYEGIKLSGWYVPAQTEFKHSAKANAKADAKANNKLVILFCHGNAGNIGHRLSTLKIFQELDVDTFIFDYSGYGESQGVPSEKAVYNDVLSAWNYLVKVRGIPPERIIIFGRSLGGSIGAWLAKEHPPHALIIESTFTSMESLTKEIYPYLPVRLILKYKFKTQEYLKKVTCPILVIHSTDDELIPFAQGQSLYEGINTKKEFLQISGDHNDGFLMSGKRYVNGLRYFIYYN
jgi:hypothetical protein